MEFEVLAQFARHTRQSDQEAGDLTKLAQKWLALHASDAVSSMPLIYSQIAGDFALLQLRTHTPPLSSYARAGIDVGTFVFVLKNGLQSNTPIEEGAGPSFSQFCNALFPKPVGEETWEPYMRKDHWKKAAYFLALNAVQRPQFHALVEAIYFADKPPEAKQSRAEKDHVADLQAHLVKYASRTVSVKEVGALIGKINLDKVVRPRVVVINQIACQNKEEDSDEDARVESQQQQQQLSFELVGEAAATDVNWDAIRKHEKVQDYRKRAGLNVTFSTPKLVRQMVLSALGYKGDEPVCSPLLAQHQTVFVPVKGLNEADWNMLMQALASFATDPSTLIDAEAPGLVGFFHQQQQHPSRSFLTSVLSFYYNKGNGPFDAKFKRVQLKTYPQLDKSIVKAVVDL